ncbi:hypothetical protein ATANTOWER_012438 [Ataeniobius toweri]|uniref:Uncharacterized protein n=1 Tax=Ataeniobius toweri TaxID=208326 RepID=A0ABU7AXK1_9TELE|nr:hypothetical protein [Ataeniobius toweri]
MVVSQNSRRSAVSEILKPGCLAPTTEEEDFRQYWSSLFNVPVSKDRNEPQVSTSGLCLNIEVLDEICRDIKKVSFSEQELDNNIMVSKADHSSPRPNHLPRPSITSVQQKTGRKPHCPEDQNSKITDSANASTSDCGTSACITAGTSKKSAKPPTSHPSSYPRGESFTFFINVFFPEVYLQCLSIRLYSLRLIARVLKYEDAGDHKSTPSCKEAHCTSPNSVPKLTDNAVETEEEKYLEESEDEMTSDSLNLTPPEDDSCREEAQVMQNQTAGFGSEQFCDLDGFSPLGLDTDTGCPGSPVQSHCDGLHTCQFSVRDSDPTGWLKRGKCFNMYKGCF